MRRSLKVGVGNKTAREALSLSLCPLCSFFLNSNMPQTSDSCQAYSSAFVPGMRAESELNRLQRSLSAGRSLRRSDREAAQNRSWLKRHWMAQCGVNYRCCKEECKYLSKWTHPLALRGNFLLIHFTHLFLKAKTLISAILEGLYHHVPSNCLHFCLFGLKSNESSGKHSFTMPNGRQSSDTLSCCRVLDTV